MNIPKRFQDASGNILTTMTNTAFYVAFGVIALAILFVLIQTILDDDGDE